MKNRVRKSWRRGRLKLLRHELIKYYYYYCCCYYYYYYYFQYITNKTPVGWQNQNKIWLSDDGDYGGRRVLFSLGEQNIQFRSKVFVKYSEGWTRKYPEDFSVISSTGKRMKINWMLATLLHFISIYRFDISFFL